MIEMRVMVLVRPGMAVVFARLFCQEITQEPPRCGSAQRRERIALRQDGACSGANARAKYGVGSF